MNIYSLLTPPKHKTFISFHHANDEWLKKLFVKQWGEQLGGFIDQSVDDGDIDKKLPTETIREKIRDEYIRNATVTIVLIGKGTWRRRHVDWEIASGIRSTKLNSRTGLIGILLPTYEPVFPTCSLISLRSKFSENGGIYNPRNIPPRLWDNVEAGYAKIYSWPTDGGEVRKWIDDAFKRRDMYTPVNGRDSFVYNKPETLQEWV